MTTADLCSSLSALLRELVHGTAPTGGFVLNPEDQGLLASLARMDAAQASASSHGGATIAAHIAHLAYGLSLMNRWATEGGNPFVSADWAAAWRVGAVSDAEWARLQEQLRGQCEQWLTAVATPRELQPIELTGVMGSVVHLAYHLGAIRQIDATARGPKQTTA